MDKYKNKRMKTYTYEEFCKEKGGLEKNSPAMLLFLWDKLEQIPVEYNCNGCLEEDMNCADCAECSRNYPDMYVEYAPAIHGVRCEKHKRETMPCKECWREEGHRRGIKGI